MTSLTVINALETSKALDALGSSSVDVVRQVYCDHAEGRVREASHSFLHLPSDVRAARGIALPSAIAGSPFFGMKWICSSPTNVDKGLPRAAGLLVLSDADSGQPVAALPAGEISTFRTAASAVLAVEASGLRDINSCCVIGAGRVSEAVVALLRRRSLVGPETRLQVSDVRPERAAAFAASVRDHLNIHAVSLVSLQRSGVLCDLLVLATSAPAPYIERDALRMTNGMILHLSLRDLAPAAMASLEHWTDARVLALGEGTSLGLAVADGIIDPSNVAELGEVLTGRRRRAQLDNKILCFSPFGLGALDLAVGVEIFRMTAAADGGTIVDEFEVGG